MELPDNDPWRAWSNFTFTTNTGHVREVDLLVIAPGGVFLMELKDWHGSLESRNGSAAPHDTEGAPHFEQRRIDAPRSRRIAAALDRVRYRTQ